MQNAWQVQEAKSKFSAVLAEAERSGPQSITRRGQLVAVIVSAREYERLSRPKTSLVSFLASLPLGDLDLERDRNDFPRDVDL
ncbi:MAG: type II toxin-antitoxin system Phd/YefM family antitoxin [Candidatus Eremiobacteraeota bacterium]|nr:type II toxin-antitoxin system Phd/YefM family antitoxin [Candidatus Eremiobacteraeota bacterium]